MRFQNIQVGYLVYIAVQVYLIIIFLHKKNELLQRYQKYSSKYVWIFVCCSHS